MECLFICAAKSSLYVLTRFKNLTCIPYLILLKETRVSMYQIQKSNSLFNKPGRVAHLILGWDSKVNWFGQLNTPFWLNTLFYIVQTYCSVVIRILWTTSAKDVWVSLQPHCRPTVSHPHCLFGRDLLWPQSLPCIICILFILFWSNSVMLYCWNEVSRVSLDFWGSIDRRGAHQVCCK